MTWRHAILEIYEPRKGGWPTDGTPATWISDGLVGWCDGEVNDVLAFASIRAIVKAKLDYWWETIKWKLFWRWIEYPSEKVSLRLFVLHLIGKYDPYERIREFEAWLESTPVVDDDDSEGNSKDT